jgi:hypothetical protein
MKLKDFLSHAEAVLQLIELHSDVCVAVGKT